jgi:hypothetical protein
VWYCRFVHSESLVAGAAVVAIEVFSHVDAGGAAWALLAVSLDSSVLVNGVKLQGEKLDLSMLEWIEGKMVLYA